MHHQESLKKIKDHLITDAQGQITEGMKMYLIERYGNTFSESDIIEMLATLSFTAVPIISDNHSPQNHLPRVPRTKRKAEGTIACILTRNANAKGIFDILTHSLTVLKGSTINPIHLNKIQPMTKKKRETLIAEYTERRGDELVVVKNVTFDSPSGAANFCVGGSSNGWRDWRDEKNNELNIYR